MNQFDHLPPLSVSSINCNSLNMSVTSKQNQIRKIYGIVKLKTDIIFLSDVRICNRNLVNGISDILRVFQINPYQSYNFLYNSSSNKRGVGILTKRHLDFTEELVVRDPEENYILVWANYKGNTIILGAIYGPNDDNPGFFESLQTNLQSLGNHPIIIGGDWNCTFSCDNIINNIDCYKMRNLPNARHSRLLADMCDITHLVDPFRSLHPNQREFSFFPRNVLQLNRSRLDFFLVSENIVQDVSDCSILPSLQSKLFDHRAIVLSISGTKPYSIKKPAISRSILKDDNIDLVVFASVFEAHLHHLEEVGITREEIENKLAIVGNIKNLIRRAGPPPYLTPTDLISEERVANREACIMEANALRADLDVEILELIPHTVDNDIFMETLLNCVRNDVISYQSFINRTKKNFISDKLVLLKDLKNNYEANSIEISGIETILDRFAESELISELEKYSIFDHINQEKITPYFLKLAKSNNSEGKLANIVDNNGGQFANDSDRKLFIKNFYADIYKLDETEPDWLDGSIEQFLGPAICNHPIVRDSKISEQLKLNLEAPLTLEELDKAMESAKIRTAAGPDGIDNSFLKKFWKYFRTPLLAYSHTCFNKKRLTPSFSTASLKLIPKKGDTTLIKNWRPISLLNCTYKIISKAINFRLQKVVDTVTSRAQKGFTSSRLIQEVLINVIETISYCNSSNSPAFLLALDQSKAFDKIRHSYLSAVYRFFGFGNNFIDMLCTITENRTASIVFDDGSYSDNFMLECGAPQGNSPSPVQYNIGEQILLFRIELDPAIASVYNHLLPPHNNFLNGNVNNENACFAHESNRETNRAEAFADDTTICTAATQQSLDSIKIILSDFASLSGLKTNLEKSVLMPIGGPMPVDLDLDRSGFTIADNITILGINIKSDLSNLQNCHSISIEKIRKIIAFWQRFNLSLPGRIGIAKNLLLPQINYLGCIITPSQEHLNIMASLTEKFVVGKLNIAKSRFYLPTNLGGLGLINIDEFLRSQQVTWIKKASTSTRDNWRVDLTNLFGGNCLISHPDKICMNRFPILHNIAVSFTKFLNIFNRIGKNLGNSYLLHNPALIRGRNNLGIIDARLFNNNVPRLAIEQISSLKVRDIANNQLFLHRIEDIGVQLSMISYMRLQEAFFSVRNNLGTYEGVSCPLAWFFSSFKNGSKSIRRIFEKDRSKKIKVSTLTSTTTFCRLIGIPSIDESILKMMLSVWGLSFLSNKHREFSFKFYNNTLGLNTRLSHFVDNNTRSCTFCTVNNSINPQEETFLHLFLECQYTDKILCTIRENFVPEITLRTTAEKKMLWLCGSSPNAIYNKGLFIQAFCSSVMFTLWEHKLKKKKLTWALFREDLIHTLGTIYDTNLSFRDSVSTLNLSICRNWDVIRGRRG